MRVALFVTCLNDTLFPQTGIASVRLLEGLGHAVEFPTAQTCCGQMHFNSGYQDEALALARRFSRVFGDAEVIVAPSASCVAMVHEFYPYLAEQARDARLAQAVSELTPRVLELTQFLGRYGSGERDGSFEHRVAYHPTCHSLRILRVGDLPRRLLREIDGLELAEVADAEECCGFGGTFAVKNAATSNAILDDKVEALLASGAEVVTALDNSCLMQIGGALSRRRSSVRALHVAEILAGDIA